MYPDTTPPESFGQQLLHAAPTAARIIRRVILFLIPAIGLSIVGVIGITSPDTLGFQADELWIPWVILGAAALYSIFMILWSKPFTATIYENGLIYHRRNANKKTEVAFKDASITDIIESQSLYGVIRFFKTRAVTVNTERFTRSNTPIFRDFADTLVTAHTLYMIKDLTAKNVFEKELSFGTNLILKRGDFIHNEGKRSENIIPLRNVRKIEVSNSFGDESDVLFHGEEGEKPLLRLSVTKVLNLNVLQHVVELANESTAEASF